MKQLTGRTTLLIFVLVSGAAVYLVRSCGAPVGSSIPMSMPKLPEPFLIEVTGRDYRWEVRYPGVDELFATEDDTFTVRDIHVPLEMNVTLVLKSADYVYTLALPEFGLKEIAIPTLEFRLAFRPMTIGQFALDGDELCGDPHPELQGHLIVESHYRFLAWLSAQRKPNPTNPAL